MRDPQTGALSELTVIGILKETAPFTMAGLSTSQRTLAPLGDRALPTTYFFRLRRGADATHVASQLEAAFLPIGMQAEATRDTLADIVRGSKTMNQIILGFLGLGLVIGVAALGVVSARSVAERRQQIGVLRAIGFQCHMVQLSFLIESSIVALTAIVLGTLCGVAIAINVIDDAARQPSWSQLSVRLPWSTFAIVFTLVYAGALIATYIPARRASRIPPASALRYQ